MARRPKTVRVPAAVIEAHFRLLSELAGKAFVIRAALADFGHGFTAAKADEIGHALVLASDIVVDWLPAPSAADGESA